MATLGSKEMEAKVSKTATPRAAVLRSQASNAPSFFCVPGSSGLLVSACPPQWVILPPSPPPPPLLTPRAILLVQR